MLSTHLLHLLHELQLLLGEVGRPPLSSQGLVRLALPQLLQHRRVREVTVWSDGVGRVKGRQGREEAETGTTVVW